jgi:hypothetical protein
MEKENLLDMTALTPLQEGMLFHYLKDPDSGIYFEQLSLSISGEIDKDCFKRAWVHVAQTNEILRTCFRWKKLKEPVRVVLKEHEPEMVFYDSPHDIERVKAGDRKKGFNLTAVPFRLTLCGAGRGKYVMIISNHHILYDGWSSGILLKEFFAAYRAFYSGSTPPRLQKTPYKEYIKWLSGRAGEEHARFWSTYLHGIEEASLLSVKKKEASSLPRRSRRRVALEPGLTARFKAFARARKLTPACVFYSAWGLLLQRYNNGTDVLFGTTVSGRTARLANIEEMVGLFINTAPLRLRTCNGGNETIEKLLRRVQADLVERERHETVPLAEITAHTSSAAGQELFDTLVVIENYPLENVLPAKGSGFPFTIDAYGMIEDTHYDLTLGIDMPGGIELCFDERVLSPALVHGMAGHYTGMIAAIIDSPGLRVRELDVLTPGEKEQLLHTFNQTHEEFPGQKTIHTLCEEQAEMTPDRTAIAGPGHGTYLSYGQLNRRAAHLARRLESLGAGQGAIIAIKMERSIEMVICMLSILKTGAAYLPIAPDHPGERARYMLKDSAACILVTGTAPHESTVLESGIKAGVEAGSLAYVLYTSGTTGKPKGVMTRYRFRSQRRANLGVPGFWVLSLPGSAEADDGTRVFPGFRGAPPGGDGGFRAGHAETPAAAP